MNILGLDPATRSGFAHSNGEHGVWDLNRNRWPDMPGGRLHKLRDMIMQVQSQWGPIELIAFEESSFGTRSGDKRNVQTMIFHCEMRGIIRESACDIGARLLSVNPSSLKAWATDNGHATKQDMMRMLDRHYGLKITDDNEADAIWILKWAQHCEKHPHLRREVMPKKRKIRTSTPTPKLF